jgi:hypothetical protein
VRMHKNNQGDYGDFWTLLQVDLFLRNLQSGVKQKSLVCFAEGKAGNGLNPAEAVIQRIAVNMQKLRCLQQNGDSVQSLNGSYKTWAMVELVFS